MNSRQIVVGHFINGEERNDGAAGSSLVNPATGDVIGAVLHAGASTLDLTVAAAAEAFPEWRDCAAQKRARIMFRYKQLLEENEALIAQTISTEHGKTIDDAIGEFRRGVEVVEYACAAPELLKGEYSKAVGPGIDSWSEHQPLGIVAGITPFNFPAMVPLWMFPMALVCGNCFILKPSEKDPSVSLILARLLTEAGLPPGVFSVLNGGRELVDRLLVDPRISAVSFVGSTPVAEHIYTTATKHGKRVQALGGAKNHAVLMPDANLEVATKAIMGAAYGSCGERCMAISVVVCVGDAVADELVDKLATELSHLRIGPGNDPATDMGPLISQEHRDKVAGYVDLGVDEGAKLIVDGRHATVSGYEDGFFIGGSLLDYVDKTMRVYQEEIFGPVLCVMRVSTQEEAMKLINAHEYGNGTCIFTRDGESARYFTDQIHVGMVGVNVPLPVPVASHSFGGWKRSLFGDLYAYGPDSVRFYTRRKTVTQRWPSSSDQARLQFSFPSNEEG